MLFCVQNLINNFCQLFVILALCKKHAKVVREMSQHSSHFASFAVFLVLMPLLITASSLWTVAPQCGTAWHLTSFAFPRPAVQHLIILITGGVPCQHGFMCGCKQWSNDK